MFYISVSGVSSATLKYVFFFVDTQSNLSLNFSLIGLSKKKKSVPWVYYPYSQHLLLEFEALWQQGQQEFNLLPLKI